MLNPEISALHTLLAVADSVQVELGAPAVGARLSAAASWLTARARACDQEGGPSTTVAIHLGDAAEAADADGTLMPLVWEAAGAAGVFTRFAGELRLTALDPDRSELRLTGSYRPAPGADGQPDDVSVRRAARAALRSFLRRVAQGLEQEQPHAAAAPVRDHSG